MHRRTLLKAALAAPFARAAASHAQALEKRHRIGLLIPASADEPSNVPGFLEGLRELGYEEGRNLVIERRYAGTSEDKLVELARELVKANVELIVAAGPSATRAAREATSAVPIVMGTHDPVEQGLIASLAQPGGNMTGWCVLSVETVQKQFSLLKEAMNGVLDAGRKSDAQTVAMASGKANVMDVVTAVADTDVAVSTLVSVRDKVIQSYEDIMKMPI